MKCKLCGFKFCGGTHRIRGHFLKFKGRGVGFCSAEESKLRPAAAELRKVEGEPGKAGAWGKEAPAGHSKREN